MNTRELEATVMAGSVRGSSSKDPLDEERERIARIERDRELGYELHRWADRTNHRVGQHPNGHWASTEERVQQARSLADWIIRETVSAGERLRCR